MSNLNLIKIVLCNTSHPGNIGSAARAIKTMGMSNMVLVDPHTMPDDHSIALASNASDVVENAIILDNLDAAIDDSILAIAMTSRKREFNQRLFTPKEIVPEILAAIAQQQPVSIVFGAERNGLTIDQLEKCNRLVTIPGNPEYFSLNLAQAIQIVCYEIYSNYNPSLTHMRDIINPASIGSNQRIVQHLNDVLHQIQYYKNKNEELTLRRINNIINKASLTNEEVDLLHGILKKIEKSAPHI